MKRIDFFTKEELDYLPLFYNYMFELDGELVDKMESGSLGASISEQHNSFSYPKSSECIKQSHFSFDVILSNKK